MYVTNKMHFFSKINIRVASSSWWRLYYNNNCLSARFRVQKRLGRVWEAIIIEMTSGVVNLGYKSHHSSPTQQQSSALLWCLMVEVLHNPQSYKYNTTVKDHLKNCHQPQRAVMPSPKTFCNALWKGKHGYVILKINFLSFWRLDTDMLTSSITRLKEDWR